MKIRHFCPFCAIPAISVAVHISVTVSNFYLLTVFNQFVLLFVFINYLMFRSNNFVILFIYGEIKLLGYFNNQRFILRGKKWLHSLHVCSAIFGVQWGQGGGEGASVVLVGQRSIDGVIIKIPQGQMFDQIDQPCTLSFPDGLVKTEFELLDQLRLTQGDERWWQP